MFGRPGMFWFRMELSLGRNSLAGTTVCRPKLPWHIFVDEHHQTLLGEKVYIATTVACDCILGASVAKSAGTEDLREAYGVFADEAKDMESEYCPETVNMDGWKWTRAALLELFPKTSVLRCFLHGWLSIRDRSKNLKEQFYEIGKRVWDCVSCRQKNRRFRNGFGVSGNGRRRI